MDLEETKKREEQLAHENEVRHGFFFSYIKTH